VTAAQEAEEYARRKATSNGEASGYDWDDYGYGYGYGSPPADPDVPPPGNVPHAASADATPSKPEIVISTDIREVIDRAERALLAVGGIYTRGRALVQVVRERMEVKGLQAPMGMPLIATIGDARLREMMSSSADWKKFVKLKDGEALKAALPPDWAPRTLRERGEWPFPALDGISNAPVLRPDGTIQDTPGYDAGSRMIFMPEATTWPTIKRTPTQYDAAAALAALADPFCDVPFREPSDQAAAIALTLSITARPAINGPVPAYKVGSTTPGAGKGLTADVATIIATGREAAKMAPTRDDGEIRKRLLAIGLASPAAVVFDNIEGTFGSESLAMALTAGSIRERLLGITEDREVELRTVFIITGNNIQLVGDLGRRVIPIDIEPRMEHPEDRHGFRYPDLKAHVTAARPQFVAAALTLLRAFFVAGLPSHGRPAKGSFEAWDRVVRGAIIWAGGADPCGGVERLRAEGDADLERLRALTTAWVAEFGRQSVTVMDLLARAPAVPSLRAAIEAYAVSGSEMNATRLGQILAKYRGRIVGGLSIEHSGTAHGGGRKWVINDPR
jgi:hypothetical protein